MTRQVLDPASGSRMFWFDKADERAIFGDIRREDHVLCDGRELHISPDLEMDFRAMPFDDDTFRLVVFDPPHLIRAGAASWTAAKYGVLLPTWRDDLRAGFAECFRVLRPGGVLIFKWNEDQIPVRDVLALTPERPLFGHRSGRASKTHWIAFIRPEPRERSHRMILHTSAHCITDPPCKWVGTTDKDAEKHVRETGHATVSVTIPAQDPTPQKAAS